MTLTRGSILPARKRRGSGVGPRYPNWTGQSDHPVVDLGSKQEHRSKVNS